jgi:type I restriction enzyme S subunit
VTGQLSRTQGNVPTGETGDSLLLRLIDERRERMQAGARKVTRIKAPTPPDLDGRPQLPAEWAWASLDQLSWASSYGTSAKCARDAKGPAVLRIPNIQNRTIQTTDLKFADSWGNFDAEDFVAPGDFLLIRTNGSKALIGRAAVVQSPPEPRCSFASYLIRFRLVGDATIWEWISTAWDSERLRKVLESRAATTAGQYNLSLSRLADLPIPIPPKHEMMVIIREVARRFDAADRLARSLDRQLAKASITRQSLLRETFEGRLVPQDPKDEPASFLLERIRTKRQSQPKQLRPKRMTKARRKDGRRPIIDVLREFSRPVTPEELFHAAGFDESQVDVFYHELAALRSELREIRPTEIDAKLWPENASVLLQLSTLDPA